MSREDYVAVAARLFALYLAFDILKLTPGAVQLFEDEFGLHWAAMYSVALLLGLLVCWFLWYFPLTVARKLLPVMRVPTPAISAAPPAAMALGITLIGVWFLAYALTDATYWLSMLLQYQRMTDMSMLWTAEQTAGVAATAAQLVLACVMIFGSTGIRRLIYRFRHGESPVEPPNEPGQHG